MCIRVWLLVRQRWGNLLNCPDGSEKNAYNEFLKNPVSNTTIPCIQKTDAGEVYNIIKSFKIKATRDTKISALKIANQSYVFTNALAGVIYNSVQQGILPNQLKIARVTPIYKERSNTDVSNL